MPVKLSPAASRVLAAMEKRDARAANPAPPPPEATRWKPGQSGNPAGSRRAAGSTVRDIAKQAAPAAMRVLVGLMKDKKTAAATRAKAAELVLLHAHGRPGQAPADTGVGLADFLAALEGGGASPPPEDTQSEGDAPPDGNEGEDDGHADGEE